MASRAEQLTKSVPIEELSKALEKDGSSSRAKLEGLIAIGSEKLTASQAIIDAASSNEVYKLGKTLVKSLLAPAKDVLAVLNVVSTVHPAVQVAVGVFSVLVKMELDRRDNDKHIAVLYHTMTDLLFVLSYLDPVFNHDSKLKSLLIKQLETITTTMNSFGNFCELYYKHKSVVRMVMSSRYKDKLADFAGGFTNQKQELHFLTAQHTATTVTQISSTLDGVSIQVDKIVAFLDDVKSEKEKQVQDMITRNGGPDATISNDKLLADVAAVVGDEVTAAVKYTLRADLQSQLSANEALYTLKLEATAVQLKEAYEKSTEKILLRLDAGPHDLIEDPDIREVWKDMAWRSSCKARHFVDAVQQHFEHVFSRHEILTGDPHPDKWTLKFLSKVVFYPAIGDAIDSDGSGYIAVREANAFFQSKPASWSVPQWLAYWAAGWYQNALIYMDRAGYRLDAIDELLKTARSENKPHLADYPNKYGLSDIRVIVESMYDDTLDIHGIEPGDEMDKLEVLVKEKRRADLKYMKDQLAAPKYQLDSFDAVYAVMGTANVEVHALTLIYLILQRHEQILELAQTLVLAEQEFYAMQKSLESIGDAFRIRLFTLVDSWRQQRLDPKLQTQCFAGGMFEDWWKKYLSDDAPSESSDDEEESDYDDDDDSDDDGDGVDGDSDNEASAADEKGGEDGEDKEQEADGQGEEDQDEEQEEGEQAEGDDGSEEGSVPGSHAATNEKGSKGTEGTEGTSAKERTSILVYPLPPQPEPKPEPEQPTETVEQPEQPEPEAEAVDVEKTLDDRVAAVETRLEKIEGLLQEMLKLVSSLSAPTPEAAPATQEQT